MSDSFFAAWGDLREKLARNQSEMECYIVDVRARDAEQKTRIAELEAEVARVRHLLRDALMVEEVLPPMYVKAIRAALAELEENDE